MAELAPYSERNGSHELHKRIRCLRTMMSAGAA